MSDAERRHHTNAPRPRRGFEGAAAIRRDKNATLPMERATGYGLLAYVMPGFWRGWPSHSSHFRSGSARASRS